MVRNKSIIAGYAGAGVIIISAWLLGYNFNTRGVDAFATFSLSLAGFLAGYIWGETSKAK